MMPRLVRKAALLIGATAVTGSAFLAATPTPASAAQEIPKPVLLPYCVQASDSPGRSAQLCVNSITSTTIPGYSTSESVTGNGSLKVCTSTYSCSTVPLVLNATGFGLNPNAAVPTITYAGSTTIDLSTVCVGTIVCTPGSVSVPRYNVTLFSPGSGPVETVCVDGICSTSPLAPVVVSSSSLNQLVALSTS
jgi:hypothetical protein